MSAPFTGPNNGWNPNAYPADPHSESYIDVGHGTGPVSGPVPDNIVTGGRFQKDA